MSLEHAILGFLNYRPFTGYDLKKVFDTSVQHFWSADQSQIYRTLNALTKKGWVEMEKVAQQDRPDRKVYHISDSGKEELLHWLSAPPLMGSPHSAPLVQVFFSAQLPDEELLAKFEGFAAMMRAVLEQYEQIPENIEIYKQQIPSEREHYFWMLTLDNGIRSM
ncbi:MAG TPA: PadR family transcriptional regulator, partial [Anaerolineaceae bacterium]|nr:PadR family transcriptional regulator [Anaerolineaceae bacterium]